MAYYFDKFTDVDSNEQLITCRINNQMYKFYTDNNVFSKKYLDFGTRSLLESLDLTSIKGDILDFGCGYGPIGIYIKHNCTCDIDMIDINERALNLAKKNAKLNMVKANIFESDVYSKVSKKYDYIITNPPIRVGKDILYSILLGAYVHLKKLGCLIFVVHKDQGAKSLIKKMAELYDVEIINKNKGFFVIKCQKA